MGLIKAAVDATISTFADAWKEYFVCDAIDNDILMVKGEKKTNRRSLFSNNGSDNLITNGSGIVVADGQCMMIVQDGMVTEFASEPGLYTFDMSMTPSFFGEGFFKGAKNIFDEMTNRFSYGGLANKDERIYYFNIKEIVSNKYGTASPVPFRVLDKNIGLDVDISVRCNGEYSFKITNPMLFYTNVVGNVKDVYHKRELESQMKTEFLTALQPALAKIAIKGVRYSEVPLHLSELCDALNEELSSKWASLRGIKIVSVGMNAITASKEDEDMIKSFQKSAVLKDPRMAAANLAAAQADAMRLAADNKNGAMMGFMGMNQAINNGGLNISDLYNMKEENQKSSPDTWTFECGNLNDGNFCSKCGKAKPSVLYCSACGAKLNPNDKFCSNCGKKI